MSEIGDIFEAIREERREKKLTNRKRSIARLRENNIEFIKYTEIHLFVDNTFDFFPSTGLFIERATKKQGRGVFNLIKRIKKKN